MSEYTLERLRRTLAVCVEAAGPAELTELTPDARFADLGYDSLTVYELVTRLQDELGLLISDEEIDRLTTPGLVLEFVNSKLSVKELRAISPDSSVMS